jgi:DnaJ-class molecular chaperone
MPPWPGAGLGHLFDPPTLPARCPTCRGCGFSTIQRVQWCEPIYWWVVVCDDCSGGGIVTSVKLAEIRARPKP